MYICLSRVFFYTTPSPEVKLAQSLRGQLTGSQFLICFLKSVSDGADLMLSGTKAHILGPKYLKVSIPIFIVFGIRDSWAVEGWLKTSSS